MYGSWIVAWAVIGHAPREMLDDPKHIGGIMDIFYLASVLLILPWPLLAIVGFFVTFVCPIKTKHNRPVFVLTLSGLYILMCAIAYGILMVDPGRIFSWWCD